MCGVKTNRRRVTFETWRGLRIISRVICGGSTLIISRGPHGQILHAELSPEQARQRAERSAQRRREKREKMQFSRSMNALGALGLRQSEINSPLIALGKIDCGLRPAVEIARAAILSYREVVETQRGNESTKDVSVKFYEEIRS